MKDSAFARCGPWALVSGASSGMGAEFARQLGALGLNVILVASVAGYACTPCMANYMASKAYLISLGEALHFEMKNHGVDVLVLAPGSTNTRPDVAADPGAKRLDAAKMNRKGMGVTPTVAVTLKALGRKPAVVPGLMPGIMTFVFKHVTPRTLNTRIFGSMIREAVLQEYRWA